MSLPKFKIGNRSVGFDFDPLVIVEIGINHGGSLEVAKKMVDAAYEAGAEIIKHQTHIIEDEMSDEAKKIIPIHTKESIYEIIKKSALTEKQEMELQEYVINKGMMFISTPFSRAAADRLASMDIPAFKIGSGECNNYPLLKHVASFGKPIILSTGMNTIPSINKAVEILNEFNVPYALLHCTNIYPTPNELVRLNALNELRDAFPKAVIGLSDHTTTIYPCIASVVLGASILERHFTDTKRRMGPDISCSMNPKELKELIIASKIIKDARGGNKGLVEAEKPTMQFAYASVVSIKSINAGEKLSKENIWVKRPGTGDIPAEKYDYILGKKARKNIKENKQLTWEDIEE